MAATKRKADHGTAPSTKEKSASVKRPRKSDVSTHTSSATAKPESAAQTRLFQDEEKAFPRGGGSALTPLEHKQIQIQANQDVLFEQAGQKRSGADGLSDEGSAMSEEEAPKASRRRSKKPKPSHEEKEQVVRVEGLSYAKLALGQLVLGQITNITSQGLTLALPNNLVGHVPLTAISDKLTEKLENLLKEEHFKEDESSEDEDFEDVDLTKIFRVGQYLRACITSTLDENSDTAIANPRKRIELSVHPKLVNRGFSKSNMVVNSVVQASVVSNEDHGLVMDMGVDEPELKAFLPKSEVGQTFTHTKIQEGAVFMTLLTNFNQNGRIVKLSLDQQKLGNLKKLAVLSDAPTIDTIIPGTAVDLLVTETTSNSITGKILGLVDATSDLIHSGATEKGTDLSQKHKIGSKVKARVIFTCPESDSPKVGVSTLEHVLSLTTRTSGKPKERKDPHHLLPISSIIDEATVAKVEPRLGVFLNLAIKDVVGFAHISRLADGRVDAPSELTGPFELGSKHRARVIGYNALDGMFLMSLEQKVLDQAFIRLEDINIGEVIKGTVQKLIADKNGSTAVIVSLSEGITGLVNEMHLADVPLKQPERKFREGTSVTARVLSIDLEKRQLRLTLKKSLVNSDVQPWCDYSDVSEGAAGPGTLLSVKPHGALVGFYGSLKAWLPVAEMSEAYIEDATRTFKKGQTVNVRVISVDAYENRMLVSCKDPNSVGAEKEAHFKSLNAGDIVKGIVIEKSLEFATVDIGHGVKGTLRIGQLTDGSEKKDHATMKKVHAGGVLEDLVVLDKHSKSRNVTLSNKPGLRKDAQSGTLITDFERIKTGATVHGFVRGILPDRVYVEFAGGIFAPVFKSQLAEGMTLKPNFGLRQDESIAVRVTHIDPQKKHFWLSMRPKTSAENSAKEQEPKESTQEVLVKPIDSDIKSTRDLTVGAVITVCIRSIKDTQLNVKIADNVQGRISVAELFESWDEIVDKKRPVSQFSQWEKLRVKILGIRDARNHRFLPISNRQGGHSVYELTAKKSYVEGQADLPSLETINTNSSLVGFVNNITDRCVWVNVSTNVRGRVELFDLTDDLSLLSNVERNFPIGSALKVRVKSVDASAGRLDLTAASNSTTEKPLMLEDLSVGLILPARITKVHESSIVVQINSSIAGPVYLEQLADDYDKAKPSEYKEGEILRVCITEVDIPNKKLGLSARPSRVLNSSLPVKDPEIKDREQIQVNQVLRGFVKKVTDTGIYVRLGPHIDAFVRVTHLSDTFLKDWKSEFQVDQLVRGKIISDAPDARNPQMSLKKSIIEGTYVKPVEFSDLNAGDNVTAKVRHVADYGVFLVVDNSKNVSGLCHVSQLADTHVAKEKVKDLYKKDDVVKAKVLKVDVGKRKIDFSLKYSLVKGEEGDEDDESGKDEEMEDISDEELSALEPGDDGVDLDDEDVDMRSVQSAESEDEAEHHDELDTESEVEEGTKPQRGLETSGFDWTGITLDFEGQKAMADSSSDDEVEKKKKPKKATIKQDRTGDLDTYGPQSVADYERLLLGQPNSAELWVRYMIFQRELSEIEKARQIARRALATMNPREEKERLDVWTALLHLENDFSNDEVVDETFREACQYNDSREAHERMIKIFITSGKLDKADQMYQAMTKNKSFTPDPIFWYSYASFLMSTLQPPSQTRARALLSRATQSVPEREHRFLTQRFATLEFKSPNGDPERGRTIFEGLVSTWPKKGDIWDMYLELEKKHGSQANVRDLFERMSKVRNKKKRAQTVFKHWANWEGSVGNTKGVERVKALEKEWVEKREDMG